MSSGLSILAPTEEDIRRMIAAKVHIGDSNADHRMLQYVHGRNSAQNHIFNLGKTWEKMMMAARAIAAVENADDVVCISGKPQGQRAILKFGANTGAGTFAGRYTPGAFTNQNQTAFREPRLLIVTDPRVDHQAITEASYVNIPVIALCDSDSPSKYVDICIPCNNKGVHSIGLIWWFMAREVLRLRGKISRSVPWETMPDLFFYRAQEEIDKQEQEQKQAEEIEMAKEVDEKEFKLGFDDAPQIAPVVPEPEVAGWDEPPAETKEFVKEAPAKEWDAEEKTGDWAVDGDDWATPNDASWS